jgi:hypothetical protein
MTIFDANEKVNFLAAQSLHYDRYAGCRYFLERVDVDGRCGLVCVEEMDDFGAHTRVILEPVYHEIEIRKTSSPRARYDRYAVFADGEKVGQFTLVLNAWVPN